MSVILPHNLGPLIRPKDWKFPTHLQKFEELTLKMIRGKLKRLCVSVSVRHGKTVWFDNVLPAYIHLYDPDARIIIAGASADLAQEQVGVLRDFWAQYGPSLNGLKLHPKFQSRSFVKFANSTGEIRGVGISSQVAGRGANWIIVDDPLKDLEEVASADRRQKVFSTFQSELISRAEPGAKAIVVSSRRHPDDLTGKLLALNENLKDEDKWEEVLFPALKGEGSATEEPLWPDRFSLQELHSIKQNYVASGLEWLWQSLYQQNAINFESVEWPAEYMPDWYDELPPNLPIRMRLLGLDPAVGKNNKTGDHPALLYIIVDQQGDIWVDDASMSIQPVDQTIQLTGAFFQKHQPEGLAVETVGFQEFVAEEICKHIQALQQGVVPLWSFNPIENKEVRIRMKLTPYLAQHKIHFRNIPALKQVRNQLQEFPNGAHDDGPDCLAMLVNIIEQLTR